MKKDKNGILINWTPIFDIKNSGYFAGTDENGKWYADTAEGLKSLNEGGVLGVLPILEMIRTDFIEYLIQKIDDLDLNLIPKTISELQLAVIKASLGISTYWAELGIEWLRDDEIDFSIAKQLNWLIEEKRYSQKFRHKATAKLRGYNKLNTDKFNSIIDRANKHFSDDYSSGNNCYEFIALPKTIIENKFSYSILWCLKNEINMPPNKRTLFAGGGRLYISKVSDDIEMAYIDPNIDFLKDFQSRIRGLEGYWILEINFNKTKLSSLKTLLDLTSIEIIKKLNKDNRIEIENNRNTLRQLKFHLEDAGIHSKLIYKEKIKSP